MLCSLNIGRNVVVVDVEDDCGISLFSAVSGDSSPVAVSL